MLKKFLILGVILACLLFLGSEVFGAYTYERIPPDFTIENPVNFDVSFDSFEIDIGCDNPVQNNWGLIYEYDYPYGCEEECETLYSHSEILASTTLNYTFVENLSSGKYKTVRTVCYVEEEESTYPVVLEQGEPYAFEILPPLPSSFIEISTNFVSSSLAYIGFAVSGLGPLLWFVIGIPIAFWVLKKVIGLAPKK